MQQRFNAPWSRELGMMTALAMAICGGAFFIGIQMSSAHPWAKFSATGILLAVLAGGVLFMVRGYSLASHTLIVHRAGWATRLDLTSLISATPDSSAIDGSIRIFGNGGLFAFSGWFRNKRLGKYRAFGTDPRRCVVLRFPNRTVVVTPENPQQFADEISKVK